jgi:choline dehydrogenase
MSMGKVLGGGSSINVMVWSRGHKNDWDYFGAEAGDPAWNYQSVLNIYRRIEDWHGIPDPKYRGTGGPVFVQPAPDPNSVALAMLEGARSVGIPTFDSPNGRMMETVGGCAIADLRIRDGRRLSIFRSYTFPHMDRPNLTVLTHALVTRLNFSGKRSTGVQIAYNGKVHRIGAGLELVLSGIEKLRIADGSIMPRVTTGNTMAPCVIIGERAADILRTEHKLQTSSSPITNENHEGSPHAWEEILIGD